MNYKLIFSALGMVGAGITGNAMILLSPPFIAVGVGLVLMGICDEVY